MLLYLYGDNLEDALGKFRYLVFYLGCGLLAALAQAFLNLNPNSDGGCIGSDIRGNRGISPFLSACKYPVFYWVLLFIGTMMVPAYLVLGIWLLEQVLLFPESMKNAEKSRLRHIWVGLQGALF